MDPSFFAQWTMFLFVFRPTTGIDFFATFTFLFYFEVGLFHMPIEAIFSIALVRTQCAINKIIITHRQSTVNQFRERQLLTQSK